MPNDSTSIIVDNSLNNLTDIALTGGTYIGELYIDYLYVKNGARVETLDRVYFNSLDIIGGELQADNIYQVGKLKTELGELSGQLAFVSRRKDKSSIQLTVGYSEKQNKLILDTCLPEWRSRVGYSMFEILCFLYELDDPIYTVEENKKNLQTSIFNQKSTLPDSLITDTEVVVSGRNSEISRQLALGSVQESEAISMKPENKTQEIAETIVDVENDLKLQNLRSENQKPKSAFVLINYVR